LSTSRCIGARTLRLRDHPDDLRQHRVPADGVGADHQAAAAVEGGADHRIAGRLATGTGSPVSMDSSRCEAFQHCRPPAPSRRAHAQAVAGLHLLQRHVLLAAVGAQPARSSAPARAAP
jgi:hypothetical protein